MKIVKFLGGLGNQMFQYAFYLSLQQRFENVKADLNGFKEYYLHQGFELESVFGIELRRASISESLLYDSENRNYLLRKLRRVLGAKYAYCPERKFFGFEPAIYSDNSTRYLWGYWQNVNYFKNLDAILRKRFTFKHDLSEKNADVMEQIKCSRAVSIHVRRGDYLTDPLLGGVCDLAYFKNAIKIIDSKVEAPLYVIFSNDISWCKDSLPLNDGIYIDWNTGSDSYIDMELMSNCKHNIISNSSFSWWGAWLNTHPEKIIISPKKWMRAETLDYSGIILNDWIAL